MQNERLIEKLNSKSSFARKGALKELKKREQYDSSLVPPQNQSEVNTSIHTYYSFSPYSPTLAAYMAYKNGIKFVGVSDYGSLKAGEEFTYACKKLGLSCICGFESTLLLDKGEEALCSFYSLSEQALADFKQLLAIFREQCRLRAVKVLEKINAKLQAYSLSISFEKDVLKLIKNKKEGTITLKHLYMATGIKLQERFSRGKELARFLRNTLCLDIEEGVYNLLCDANNPFYNYDLISALRHNFSESDANLTPPSFKEYFEVAKKHGAAIVYQYNAPENWLKNQTDMEKTLKDFAKTVDRVKEQGFNTISISQDNLGEYLVCEFVNILEQKQMLALLTQKTEYPRDHFTFSSPLSCREYVHKCAYALLGNLCSMQENPEDGLFSEKSARDCPDYLSRITLFAQIGKTSIYNEK